jgi:hypothetical protein
MGTFSGSVTEPSGKPGLVEQLGSMVEKLIEVMKSQDLLTHVEQLS